MTPLFYAVIESYTEIVELLLAHPNIDVNYKVILIQKAHMKFKINFFMIVYGILKRII